MAPGRVISFRASPEVEEWIEAERAKRSLSRQAFMLRLIRRAGGPVEGEGEPGARLETRKRVAPSHPEPKRDAAAAERNNVIKDLEPTEAEHVLSVAHCDHKWKNMGWGVICEKCKARR